MKHLKLLFLIIATGLAASCSKEYDIMQSIGEIRLNADSTVKFTGETVTFSVLDDLQNDVSGEAEFTVNGEPYSGTTLSSDTLLVRLKFIDEVVGSIKSKMPKYTIGDLKKGQQNKIKTYSLEGVNP
ncbi:MAG: hypothetical protein EOO01_36520, partial [Chitinophagaceae bacterium]